MRTTTQPLDYRKYPMCECGHPAWAASHNDGGACDICAKDGNVCESVTIVENPAPVEHEKIEWLGWAAAILMVIFLAGAVVYIEKLPPKVPDNLNVPIEKPDIQKKLLQSDYNARQ